MRARKGSGIRRDALESLIRKAGCDVSSAQLGRYMRGESQGKKRGKSPAISHTQQRVLVGWALNRLRQKFPVSGELLQGACKDLFDLEGEPPSRGTISKYMTKHYIKARTQRRASPGYKVAFDDLARMAITWIRETFREARRGRGLSQILSLDFVFAGQSRGARTSYGALGAYALCYLLVPCDPPSAA